MKKKIFSLAVVAICLSILAYGTLAYFSAEDIAHNVITSGNIDIELQEWGNRDKTTAFPANGVTGVMPGTEVIKIVEVKNTGSASAYIRVKVEKTITLEQGRQGEINLDLIELDFDSTYWEKGTDGFYYYKTALAPGGTTEPLFTKVTFAVTMDNLYQGSVAAVDVSAYAVQSANNGTSALTAAGWPV